MTSPELAPAFYNDLSLSFEKAWAIISDGAKQRKSAAHSPAVVTIDGNGLPQARIMVLRDVERDSRRLRFHTDTRSIKIAECEANSRATLLFYDPTEKAQIRLSGSMTAQSTGASADLAWAQSTPFARRCYMAETAPGSEALLPSSGLPQWIEGRQPEEADLVDARANFSVLWFEVQTFEWLYLANAGHRRARWHWDADRSAWSGTWLIP